MGRKGEGGKRKGGRERKGKGRKKQEGKRGEKKGKGRNVPLMLSPGSDSVRGRHFSSDGFREWIGRT